jgi:hypothetical protein
MVNAQPSRIDHMRKRSRLRHTDRDSSVVLTTRTLAGALIGFATEDLDALVKTFSDELDYRQPDVDDEMVIFLRAAHRPRRAR